jgi:hypothetical protein
MTLGLAACGGGSPGGAGAPAGASSTTASTVAGAPSSSGAGTTTTSAAGARNLVVTDAIRAQLVAAGAQLNSLPSSDYAGLRAGETYYAYDPTTQTYWAGAGLDPAASATQAQIAAQDDGAYLLFERAGGGAWKAYDVGLAGTQGTTCPVHVPDGVLALWGWAAGSCRPRTIL